MKRNERENWGRGGGEFRCIATVKPVERDHMFCHRKWSFKTGGLLNWVNSCQYIKQTCDNPEQKSTWKLFKIGGS